MPDQLTWAFIDTDDWGKTTVLSMWAVRSPFPVAWLSLDTLDNDPTRFWASCITALRTCLPTVGETALALLHSPQAIPFSTVLTVLRKLDGERKGTVLQEADLISKEKPLIILNKTDLSKANLAGTHLEGANLSKVYLAGANLKGAYLARSNLKGVCLAGANLSKSILGEADLNRANLNRANLSRADLSKAYLSGANLTGARLNFANLTGATVAQDQWEQARSLQGTILPNGTTHA